jgi:hypothetical protein
VGHKRKLVVGDWVEVRSKEEILQTLDSCGQLEGMPFMPEMFEFCGKRFQVFKRAHKSCDPDLFTRRFEAAVYLETRCNGSAHGGCQAGCLLFWKEAWLKPVDQLPAGCEGRDVPAGAGCTESAVWSATTRAVPAGDSTTYVCQTTQVLSAGQLIKWWDVRQYIEDWSSGNVGLRQLCVGTLYSWYYNLSQAGIGLGPAMRRLYEVLRPLWHGSRWPRTPGLIPDGQPTPTANLNLQPGELVRIKPHVDILKTVNTSNKNRGLWWDAELVPYCDKTYRVLKRVTRVIDEKSGKLLEMKTPSIILDSVVCQARYSACRMFCPRQTYAYWREIWLDRVESQAGAERGAGSIEPVEADTGRRQSS